VDLEDQQRFQVQPAGSSGWGYWVWLSCTRCPWLGVDFDAGPLTLAELNRRADEHTEACR
jgi:hypothetical protein